MTCTMSVPEALGRLLAGTGFNYRVAGNQSIVLIDPKQPTVSAVGDGATALAPIVVQGASQAAQPPKEAALTKRTPLCLLTNSP